jgi:hypothetical protein
MTTAGDIITTENITAEMRSLGTTYNAGIVWHAGNNPFSQAPTTVLAGGDSSGYPTLYNDPITDTNITASTILTNFSAYATQLSRIRSTRLLKWYQNQGTVRSTLQSDVTNIASLNSDYQRQFVGVPLDWQPNAGTTIVASDIDKFVGALSTAINNNRTTTVTIEEFYCHSNCHGSCHGSI